MSMIFNSLNPELVRIALSLLLIFATLGSITTLRHYQARTLKKKSLDGRPDTSLLDQQRKVYVLAKNTAWLLCSFIILSLWASYLATAFISLAAVTGALLIVSKELISNLYGYWIITLTRPYKIGDTISIGPIKDAKVININAMNTSVSNLFGLAASFPNSYLLQHPLTNHSDLQPTDFCIHTFSLDFPLSAPIHHLVPLATQAALNHTERWTVAANTQIEHLETYRQINLPSARPRVFVSSNQDGRSVRLTWRITCPPAEALDCEQSIILETWQLSQSVLQQKTTTPA